jgi:transcriptional regulator with XRE-family HTH domain
MSEDDKLIDPADHTYAVRVGQRLRAIRRQKRLSLQDVEAGSEQEFKASVLGAYERGERAISVPRLQRLARFYAVPVDQLLPGDDDHPGSVIDLADRSETSRGDDTPMTVDLHRLTGLNTSESVLLGRYLGMIQVQRGDFNGRMLTVRRDDLRAIACLLDTTPETARTRLDEMGLRIGQ